MDGMDTFFISHGSPMAPLIEAPASEFWREWQRFMPKKPKAILAISAHWNTVHPEVNSVIQNDTIHDFNNFPPELYQVPFSCSSDNFSR
eukprot:c18779_g1_i3 orf=80-346(-)